MNGTIGTLFGFQVVESRAVHADQALVVNGQLVTRDAGHLVHRIRMELIKDSMRKDLQRQLNAFAARWGITR